MCMKLKKQISEDTENLPNYASENRGKPLTKSSNSPLMQWTSASPSNSRRRCFRNHMDSRNRSTASPNLSNFKKQYQVSLGSWRWGNKPLSMRKISPSSPRWSGSKMRKALKITVCSTQEIARRIPPFWRKAQALMYLLTDAEAKRKLRNFRLGRNRLLSRQEP